MGQEKRLIDCVLCLYLHKADVLSPMVKNMPRPKKKERKKKTKERREKSESGKRGVVGLKYGKRGYEG